MNKRKLILFKGLFQKYSEIHQRQEDLYGGTLTIFDANQTAYKRLQEEKLVVLDKMNNCFV